VIWSNMINTAQPPPLLSWTHISKYGQVLWQNFLYLWSAPPIHASWIVDIMSTFLLCFHTRRLVTFSHECWFSRQKSSGLLFCQARRPLFTLIISHTLTFMAQRFSKILMIL
jgi:hypothetical protein